MFNRFVQAVAAQKKLVVQPRLGVADPQDMRLALQSIHEANAVTAGTITLDSYTRTGNHHQARAAIAEGRALNGYPIVLHGAQTTASMLRGVQDPNFPVQVRHGSAAPTDIFRVLVESAIDASEGGPISYCLPYGRTSLANSAENWKRCCALYATLRQAGTEPHLETFGGCMMGQLCPPGLLVAISVLEGMFFQQNGVHSVSLSYAQQTNFEQDMGAVTALHRLSHEFLHGNDWHIVIYAYMGAYPSTSEGAGRLLDGATRLATWSSARRLIVKTAAEAHRIPTVAENVAALERAARVSEREEESTVNPTDEDDLYFESRRIIEAVLELDVDIGLAMLRAFYRGYLDVPYCLHPDNAQATTSHIAEDGKLQWSNVGMMPIAPARPATDKKIMSSSELLHSLSYIKRKYDQPELEPGHQAAYADHTIDQSNRGDDL